MSDDTPRDVRDVRDVRDDKRSIPPVRDVPRVPEVRFPSDAETPRDEMPALSGEDCGDENEEDGDDHDQPIAE